MRLAITEITRRDIFDAIRVAGVAWSGRLDESEFLARLYDLLEAPSYDARFDNAADDIWQHRIRNDDWDPDWVFSDPRFGLSGGDDHTLLDFLCETLHPAVRADGAEVERLRQSYNECLKRDGYEIVENTRLSGRPVFAARQLISGRLAALEAAKQVLSPTDPAYIAQQITRMEAAIDSDPALAIGTAKELVESCCRTILVRLGKDLPKGVDLGRLVGAAAAALDLTPTDIPEQAKASATIKRVLGNLAQITQGLAELRNEYGTGHGKVAGRRGLQARHARLAVGASSTLAVFFLETYADRLH